MRINADENTPDPMKGAKFIEFKSKIKKFDFLNNVRFASTKGFTLSALINLPRFNISFLYLKLS